MNKIPRDVRKKLDSSYASIDPTFKANLKNQLFKENSMAKKQSSLKSLATYLRSTPALAVFAAIVLVGTTSALVATDRANVANREKVEVPAQLDNVLSLDDIRAIATKDAGDASVTGIELEKEDSGLVYKVKFSDGSVRLYDAKTGEAINPANGDELPANGLQGAISLSEARQIAQNQRPGATITKIELENEHGVVVYSVRFSDGGRVDVNAQTGDVVRVRGASNSGSSSSDDDSDDDRSGSNSGSGSDDSDDDRSGSNSGSGSHGGDDDSEDDDNSGSGKDN
ncbi:MAG TPA: PepSY domain-containing protein [Candidatus Saccharibacteria bacterium]|nr:PepSY domain-containing protein [Candidatus Saccharibacteria bacterium]